MAMPDALDVILVHGIFRDGRVFGVLAHELERRGRRAHTLDLQPNDGTGGLDALAEQVAAFAERVAPRRSFDLVGFSMGGLVSRYYVQRLGGDRRVRRFVTVGAPHNGSLLAYVRRGPGCEQMRPGSPFLADLNRDGHTLEAVGVASVWTPFDLMIVPATSSRLPIGRTLRLPVALHPWLLTNRRSVRAIADLLDAETV